MSNDTLAGDTLRLLQALGLVRIIPGPPPETEEKQQRPPIERLKDKRISYEEYQELTGRPAS